VRDLPDPSTEAAALERLRRGARAAQQLCDVLWEALHEELLDPDATRLAGLSERLAEVSSTVAMLASSAPGDTPSQPPAPSASAPGHPIHEAPPSNAPVSSASAFDLLGRPAGERRTPPAPTRSARSESSSEPASASPFQPVAPPVGENAPTKLVDEQAPAETAESLATVQPLQPEIEIRDVRREEGPSAWVSSVGRLLARHAEDGLPFAVLLVEIVDVAQLERSETPHDLHGLVAKVESALGQGMRASDHLSRETLGRYWLVAPETNGTGARMLAERLARLVRTSASHRGVPMEVAIGIAVCPDDGTEAPALAARADLGVYSARATGRSIAHTDPPSAG
jgi:GGDEF domain-containing protein